MEVISELIHGFAVSLPMVIPLNIISKIHKVSSEEAKAGILGTQGASSKNRS